MAEVRSWDIWQCVEKERFDGKGFPVKPPEVPPMTEFMPDERRLEFTAYTLADGNPAETRRLYTREDAVTVWRMLAYRRARHIERDWST